MIFNVALPREGHLYQLFQVFAYLKKYNNTVMVYDPSDPAIDEAAFKLNDWTSSEFSHIQGNEELPPNMPEPCGQAFVINAKVDAEHAADTVTRRSRTAWILCVFELCPRLLAIQKANGRLQTVEQLDLMTPSRPSGSR